MCGIFAAYTARRLPAERVLAALRALSHRGPDGTGTWTSVDGRRLLGHTRLSIIGLDNGAQPISSSDGSVHLVVNGELYGYRAIRDELRADGCQFVTDSDSEIALHLYRRHGLQAVSRLRGEFAIVITDDQTREMIAIRDRFGIKPLYYASVGGEVFFASEIKALLALGVPAVWDVAGALGGMAQPHERTPFAGVSAVPPGCYAIVRDGVVRIYPYWDWEFPAAEELRRDRRSEAEVVEGFRAVLRDAVRERLVADVEVACYLSGGIDSCAVLGLAQQLVDRPIRAFTLTFDHPLYDEAAFARAQAAFVGASYQPIPITGRELADAFADAIWHCETPMFNGHGVAKFLLSRAVRDAGIKVVFTGEGSDELLGGYSYYRIDAVNDDPALTPETRSALIDEIFGANAASRAIMLPAHADDARTEAIRRRLGWMPATLRGAVAMLAVEHLLRPELAPRARGFHPIADALDRLPLAMRLPGRNRLNQALYLGAKTTLPNFILNYLGDRMEMAHSVEGRVPFLDHHVAENAARVPVGLKIKGIREKHILREAAKDVLIPEVYDRQKHPFTSPPTRDRNDPLMTFYRDTFSSRAASEQPFFDMWKARAALDQLLSCPDDERIAAEGVIQRIASVVVMQERFALGRESAV